MSSQRTLVFAAAALSLGGVWWVSTRWGGVGKSSSVPTALLPVEDAPEPRSGFGRSVPVDRAESIAPTAPDVVDPASGVADETEPHPAPEYPFDRNAPLPLPKANMVALTNPVAMVALLRMSDYLNPGRLKFTEQEAKKLLDGARAEIALARHAQKIFNDEKHAAVKRAREQYSGPRLKGYDAAAAHFRETYQGTRMGSIVIAEVDGEQASLPLVVDPDKELATYLRYKEMIDIIDVAAARIRQLIETGAYR